MLCQVAECSEGRFNHCGVGWMIFLKRRSINWALKDEKELAGKDQGADRGKRKLKCCEAWGFSRTKW